MACLFIIRKIFESLANSHGMRKIKHTLVHEEGKGINLRVVTVSLLCARLHYTTQSSAIFITKTTWLKYTILILIFWINRNVWSCSCTTMVSGVILSSDSVWVFFFFFKSGFSSHFPFPKQASIGHGKISVHVCLCVCMCALWWTGIHLKCISVSHLVILR